MRQRQAERAERLRTGFEQTPEQKAEAVEQWNARYPVGTPVICYSLINPLRNPSETRTRSGAWIMGGHSAVVMVDGVAGAVALESVVPVVVKN